MNHPGNDISEDFDNLVANKGNDKSDMSGTDASLSVNSPVKKQEAMPQQMQQQMQQQMMQQQMMQQQMMQQQNSVGPRPKLQHPDNDMSDHIDMELERIQENENENVAQHNLTNSELAEINNKIEAMNSQK